MIPDKALDEYDSLLRDLGYEKQFEKEFDEDVLRDVPFDRIAEELDHMRTAYDEMAAALKERDIITFAAPLAWCHAEFLTALLKREAH